MESTLLGKLAEFGATGLVAAIFGWFCWALLKNAFKIQSELSKMINNHLAHILDQQKEIAGVLTELHKAAALQNKNCETCFRAHAEQIAEREHQRRGPA